jgi:hypothetical protein
MKNAWSFPSKRCAMAAIALLISFNAHGSGPRLVADTFTATTANMTPAGANLRIQVIQWQDAAARTEVVATLAAEADAATLGKLPTVGYVWQNGSPVGYSVKYANHTSEPNGNERVTLVTDKRLGSYDFKGWSAASATGNEVPYSVIELELNNAGTGTGTLTLGSEVLLDEAAGTVALKDGAPSLLTNVKREASGADKSSHP